MFITINQFPDHKAQTFARRRMFAELDFAILNKQQANDIATITNNMSFTNTLAKIIVRTKSSKGS